MNTQILLALVLAFIISSPIKAMKKSLIDDFSNQNLTSIEGLTFNENKSAIDLSNNQLVNLEGNDFLASTLSLFLENNQITTLSNLPANLRSIFVIDNNLSDLDNEFPETMEIVFADNNQIVSINGLANTPNINNLSLDNNQITDISAIQNMQSLTDVSFNDNNVANINFPWPKTVEDINFSNNAIEDISPLTEITALEDLFALGGEITDIPDFSQSNNLKFISLTGHPFTELNCNFIPSSVRELNLPRNEISTIVDPCEITNPKLKKLDMASNNLTEINMTLRRARKLRTIDLSSNNLTSLENLTIKPRRASFKLDVRDNGNLPQSEIKAFKRRHPNARVKSGGFF